MAMYKTAKVCRLTDDGETKDVGFENGATVREVIEKAGFTVRSGESVRDNNGSEVSLDSSATDGARYFLADKVEAGNC